MYKGVVQLCMCVGTGYLAQSTKRRFTENSYFIVIICSSLHL